MASETEEDEEFTRKEIIRIFNDAFRLSLGGGAKFSAGFAALGRRQMKVLEAIGRSTRYIGSEEQQELHESGTATYEGIDVVWEIVYEPGSDPANMDRPFEKRMLHVKLANE